jgi:20S proteasome subunit beta 3
VQYAPYNGSAIVAMSGANCVAIGCDLRFGVQLQTMATDYQKVLQIHDRLFVGLSGLAADQVRILLLMFVRSDCTVASHVLVSK